MSLSTDLAAVVGDVKDVGTNIHSFLDGLAPHLQKAADIAAKVESSSLVQAAMSTVLGPELEQQLADYIVTLDKTLQAARQSGLTPAPAPAAEQPAA